MVTRAPCGRGASRRLLACGVAVVCVCLAGDAAAAITCTARVSRSSVPAGGELLLTVTAEGDMGWSAEFALPDMPGVRTYNGGTNQSMSMINGRSQTSVSRSWYLRVDRPGAFVIGPVVVTANGETCKTKPLRVEVTPATNPPVPPADSGNRSAPSGGGGAGDFGRVGSDVFVSLEVDKDEVWLGEQVILTFRYWRRVQPWNNPTYKPPRTEGFWREDLGPERNTREALGWRSYSVTEIRYALFPTRAGELVIEPAELTFPEDVFDRFFNSRRRSSGPRILRTERLRVNVRALPLPAPPGFDGLVANELALTAAAMPDTVEAGEPLELKLDLAADGFLQGFAGLRPPAPEGARMHDAAESFDVDLQRDRLRGRIHVEKVLVPEREGELVVPPTSVVWFDASDGRYVTTATPERRIVVLPGRLPVGEDEGSGFLRSEIARLGDDLAFIHPAPRRLRMATDGFAGSAGWWLLLGAPVVLLGGWRLALARIAADRRDPAGRRRRRALSVARAALARAGNDPAAVARALTTYVADLTDRPPAAVGAAEVADYCADRREEELGRRVAELLSACDAARFGGDRADPAALARTAGELLGELARATGGTSPSGAAAVVVLACGLALATSPLVAQRPGHDPLRLLAEGNQAYTEGDLGRALDLYREARGLGVDDPVLHYNLGNTHARRGELGEAVASYLRARRLDPRDGDVRGNLAWVRSHIRDLELAGDALPLFVRQLAAVTGSLTVDQWSVVMLVPVWLLAGLVGWGWYREHFGDALRRVALTVAAVAVVGGAVTAWRWYAERVVETAVVTAPEAAVRSGPAEGFPTLFMVHDGLTLTLNGEREDWVRVSLGGDWQGWLPQDALERVRLPAAAAAGGGSPQGR